MTAAADDDKDMLPLYNILPPEIRRRIKALKKLQLQTTYVEAKYFQEVHKLECKYAALNGEIFSKRLSIVRGKTEPTDEECDFKEEGYDSPDEDDPVLQDLRKRMSGMNNLSDDVKGIPEFWLTVLKNAGKTFDLIQPHDEPILKHLYDVKLSLNAEPMSFGLAFKFSANPYFTNKTLTKTYELRCTVDEESPWMFDGPEIVKAKGTEIDWIKGMNVMRKTVGKKTEVKDPRKHYDKMESFFQFFYPPQMSDQEGETAVEQQRLVAEDYALGIFFREKLVPNAVLYFTGDHRESDVSSSSSESETESEADIDESSEEEAGHEAPHHPEDEKTERTESEMPSEA